MGPSMMHAAPVPVAGFGSYGAGCLTADVPAATTRLFTKQQGSVGLSSALPKARYAYVTLLTRDSYLPGVQGLARSMRALRVRYPLIVIHTGKLSEGCMRSLKQEGCHLHQVQPFKPQGEDCSTYKLQLYAECWNKLYLWTLDCYERVIYLDADMLMAKSTDHLFEQLPPGFHAVRDCYNGRLSQEERDSCPYFMAAKQQQEGAAGGADGAVATASPRDYFNAGFFVMSPSRELFSRFLAYLAHLNAQKQSCGAYAEQDFLNHWYRGKWGALPWIYNAQKGIMLHHPELWQPEEAAIIHYTDAKPWHKSDPSNAAFKDIVDLWWQVFDAHAPASGGPSSTLPCAASVPDVVVPGIGSLPAAAPHLVA